MFKCFFFKKPKSSFSSTAFTCHSPWLCWACERWWARCFLRIPPWTVVSCNCDCHPCVKPTEWSFGWVHRCSHRRLQWPRPEWALSTSEVGLAPDTPADVVPHYKLLDNIVYGNDHLESQVKKETLLFTLFQAIVYRQHKSICLCIFPLTGCVNFKIVTLQFLPTWYSLLLQ